MTQQLPSETIEYERYVDGLRAALRACAEYIEGCATRNEVSWKLLADNQVLINAKKALGVPPFQQVVNKPATIAVHVEGGMVADVTGLPPGVSVRVEDYDHHDEAWPTWDAEKECLVTIYGDGAP